MVKEINFNSEMHIQHRWDLTPKEATQLQNKLASHISLEDTGQRFTTVAGIDVSYTLSENKAHAAIVVCAMDTLDIIEEQTAAMPITFPYIPGLLSFREVPVILKACNKLSIFPHLLVCDGQGIAHPRRLGLACHLGLYLDKPAIGVAKKRLTGAHRQLGIHKGNWTYLKAGDEKIGIVFRSRKKVKPIYISPGHKISMNRALSLIRRMHTVYRLPQPIRYAHRLANESKGII
ncbi:MAG: deoxyribonuclease V [Caldithrix sp.]|nr:deoxyribonuclease V [Caldithrix sp.]